MNLIEKLLREYKDTTKLKITEIDVQIKELEKQRLALCSAINQTDKEIQTICTHEKTRKVPGPYMSGGYDQVFQQEYTIRCINCDKVLDSKVIRGTYA